MFNFEPRNFLWTVAKSFANLSLAIIILFVIILFSVIGSVIEQNQDISYYQVNYPMISSKLIDINWKIITNLGIDHIFQTWWFITVLLLFIFSLASCSFVTQLPSLRNARRWKFVSKPITIRNQFSFQNNDFIQDNCLTNLIYSLLDANFFVFYQGYSVYSYKGLYGRVAPIFVHLSIITILIGSMLSSLFSFVAQELVPNGEIFHIKNIIYSGFFSRLPLDLFTKVENFSIKYNFDDSIQQFFSEISFFSSNRIGLSKESLAVNYPIKFHGITIYQTDWELNALRLNFGLETELQKKILKMSIGNKNFWLSNLYITNDKQLFFLIFNLQDSILICNSNGLVIGKVPVGQVFYIDNIPFMIKDIITSTGLQLKMDLGVRLVYLGFFVLMLSSILSYLSYSQVWIYKNFNSLEFIASTNRANLFFEEDISLISNNYQFYCDFDICKYFHCTEKVLK
uniref:Cytochrome c biogenesis protein Ccs1 n=1 Tax=Digenea simplex TaxID=945030 RepID=A0A1Z1MUA2_DIGSM|nr:cytochrome c biogenesis protein ccs1 [Digenea simplex]ARW69459.1 cytochrome c biogenesis protein ccs1 [Digenea simplex]